MEATITRTWVENPPRATYTFPKMSAKCRIAPSKENAKSVTRRIYFLNFDLPRRDDIPYIDSDEGRCVVVRRAQVEKSRDFLKNNPPKTIFKVCFIAKLKMLIYSVN